MDKDCYVSELVCKHDEHLVFNLTLLKLLNKVNGSINFICKKSLNKFYNSSGYKIKNSSLWFLCKKRIFHLTTNWKILILCVLFFRKDYLVFHNFFSFLNSRTFNSRLKTIFFGILISLLRGKLIVLSNHVKVKLSKFYKNVFYDIPIYYDKSIINSFLSDTKSNFVKHKSDFTIFGNLYEGKIDKNLLLKYSPTHYGKIHGENFTYNKSVNSYLKTSDYYNLIKNSKKIMFIYNDYSLIASGIMSDCIAFEKDIYSNNNALLMHYKKKYNLKIINYDSNLSIYKTKGLSKKILNEIKIKIKKL